MAHPFRLDLIDKNITYLKDKSGNQFVKKILKIAKTSKSGFIEYFWEDPITHKILKKLTFINSDKDLNIIVGSGIYLEDLATEYKNIFYKFRNSFILKLILLLILFLIISTFLFLFF